MSVRILVVGAGSIGARHAAAVAAHQGAKLAGVVDPDPARRPTCVAGFSTLDAVDTPVDAAIIATPTATHAEIGAACAARGWAILVEKPIAETVAEADRLIEACAAARVPLLVGHHRRQHGVVAAARAALDAGAIGRVIGVSAIWAVKKHDGYFDAPWRRGAGGSPTLINIVHDIDLLRHLMGEIASVHPVLAAAKDDPERETAGALALSFASGAVGTILFSDNAPSPWSFEAATGENAEIAQGGDDAYRFIGTRGALGFPSLTLWSGAEDWTEAPARTQLEAPPVKPPLPLQLDHLIEVVEGRAKPLCTGEDGRETLRTALRVLGL
ncbi:MAG: Gfo/Idh/MocA family oxidoreductase [Pseudomonadota bacterium]